MERLKKAQPNGRYWIKADGTDIKPALQESLSGVWNGDANLLDGKLESLRADYDKRRAITTQPCTSFQKMLDALDEDRTFLNDKLKDTLSVYQKKFDAERTSKEILKILNWEMIEIVDLLEKNQKFRDVYARNEGNRRIHIDLKANMLTYLRDLFKKKRTMATHVLVIMLSEERRNGKPYALPVQYVPYKSITARDVRRLTQVIKRKMKELGMTCLGKFLIL